MKQALTVIFGIIIWFIPSPEGVDQQAWHLFAIFITTILAVVVNAYHILVASIFGMVLAIITGTLSPVEAFSGFSHPIVLLIVSAFLIARAVVKSGLGIRIALLIIRRFGNTTLGLGYSMLFTDILIAPAFPSNTARSGLLFPIVLSVSEANGSKPDSPTSRNLGSFLMFTSMFGIGLSSALWFTAMAANPLGAEIAGNFGVDISFGSWLLASIVPTLTAAIILPMVIYRVFPPRIKQTPEAPDYARKALADMGPMKRDELITAVIFVLLVIFWGISDYIRLNNTAVAFLGLGLLMVSGVYTPADVKKEGEALSTMIWFAILFALSNSLNHMGFMHYIGELLSGAISGVSWPMAYFILIAAYVMLHYLFVSQTGHLLALFGVFMTAGISLGVPPALLAFMLLFATNFFSIITPQGSSANILYLSSGYLKIKDAYWLGGLFTLLNFIIYMILGTAWILLIF